jgi:hypothetical protein
MKTYKFRIQKITLLFSFLVTSVVFSQSTRLANSVCSKTLTNLGSNITCTINLGQGHRFEVSTPDGSIVGVYDGIASAQIFPNRSRFLFRLNFLNSCSISFNSEYRIRVSWFNGVTWSSYGEYCSVYTPATPLEVSSLFASTTVPSFGTNIRAAVNQKCGHRYEVSTTDNALVGVYDAYQASLDFPGRSPYDFRFSWMPFGTIAEGRTYVIRIASFDAVSGLWSDYGPQQTVKTPGYGETQLTSVYCGNMSLDSTNTIIEANVLEGAIEYLFTVTDFQSDTVASFTKTQASFSFSELPTEYHLEGRVYNVDIRTRRNPSFGFTDAGQTCSFGLRARTTKMNSQYCGLVYNYLIQDTLNALPIEGAQAYKFRIFDGVTYIEDTVSNLTNSTSINLIKFPGIKYCTTYQMDVKVLMNDVWGPYNEVCEVITVCNPITELRPMFCNSTVTSCGTNIYAQSILYAEGYQFYVAGGNINEIVTATSNAGFKLQNLSNVANLTYETSYLIKCRVKVGGVWGAWGEGCSVYLQTNSTLTTYCNQTIPTLGVNVMTSSVGCASDYRFRINGPNVTDFVYNSPMLSNCFRFSQINGVKFNSTYQVEVSVLVGGQWSPFGSACNVNTPTTLSIIDNNEESANSTEIKEETETLNLTSVESIENKETNDLVSIYPNPTKDEFSINYDFYDSEVVVKVFDNSGRLIETIKFNSLETKSATFGSNYPNGSYHLIIEINQSIISKKIIKLSK